MSLSILNYFFVLIYGLILSFSFANISIKRNLQSFIIVTMSFCATQLVIYLLLGEKFLYKSYPFVTHIPLIIVLLLCYKKPFNIALVSILTAYLLCTPRKWIGTMASAFWGYSSEISFLVQIIATIPLLILIIKMSAPYVAGLQQEDNKVISLFIYVPLTYYIIEYGITVYSSMLYTGGPAIVEFVDSAIVVVYFIFSVLYLKTSLQNQNIALEKANLQLLIKQSEFEIIALQEAQNFAIIYRHDMRHHLSLIGAYLADGDKQKAADYIRLALADIEEITPNRYCENNTVNLILSAFAAKAKMNGVTLLVDADLPGSLELPETELNTLLSNGLENAIVAAAQVDDEQFRTVRITCQTHKANLLIFIENSFTGKVVMENGLPQSHHAGHGFGVKSMAMIAEKNNGYCSFAAQHELFTLKIVLPLGR
ncbi:MAG: GHKL domain-containing protein [Syntrophomonas sp.]|uniref:sensor histidine kinase n=1 Tax=Syntrophomonas sp. TaxID=2053627 RepID=UPI00262ED4A7|nr:sensor histidine kinase [Syntrophomonas sp.]MDD2510440.1 GHKL domain-containing protein [Syntrophomonas sp.]MDD3878887.1 GHKL domain-containing protein [Syntrophomonas sp.]MDD4627439.1 GHKL domain-containing protein [Syntrophomonas sp.]